MSTLIEEETVPTTLRLTQTPLPDDRYHIALRFENDALAPQEAAAEVSCTLSDQDHADLRWYLESYPQFPFDPHPEMAARIERRMQEIGIDLFRSLFQANDDTRDLWAIMRPQLKQTRVEISTSVEGANALPWELLRDPKTDVPLALGAKTFVRAQSKTAQPVQRPQLGADDPIRILLVICRPGRDLDVPFRSVARRLLEGLTAEQQATYTLDVLRPPTYDRLAAALRQANAAGRPPRP